MSTGVESKLIGLLIAVVLLAFAAVFALAYWGTAALANVNAYSSIGLIAFAAVLLLVTPLVRDLTRERSAFTFITANTIALIAIVVFFGLVIFRPHVSARWIGSACVLIMLVQFGSFAFAVYRRNMLKRLFLNRVPERVTDQLDGRFQAHSLSYLGIPAGCLAGAVVAATRSATPSETIRIGVMFVLGCLALGIAAFLVRGSSALARLYLREDASTGLQVRYDKKDSLVVIAQALNPQAKKSFDQLIDAVVIASDVRRMFLINQYQQLAVFAACVAALLFVLRGSIAAGPAIVSFVVVSIITAQLPYVFGQQRARAMVLDRSRGAEREELRERLDKVAPLAPRFESWIAMTASGGAGAFAFKLIEKTIEGAAGP